MLAISDEFKALYFNNASDELVLFFGFPQSQRIILDYCNYKKNLNLPFVLISDQLYKMARQSLKPGLSEIEKILTISDMLKCQIRCFDHFYLEENIPQTIYGE